MTEVERYKDPDSWVDMLGAVGDLASKIANTEFVPRGLRSKPAAVAAAVLSGREIGLPPLTSLRSIHIIEGTPSLSAEMMFALVLNAGHQVQWIEATDQKATVRITRCDGLAEATATYSMHDARVAGLVNKDNWRKHPRSMLRHRAMTEAVSMTCPDIALALPGADVVAPVEANLAPQFAAQTGAATVQIGPAGPVDNPEDPPLGIIEVPETQPENVGTVRDTRGEHEATRASPDRNPSETVQETVPEPEMITGPQMRKLGALIGQWETLNQTKLDRDQRRALIATMSGVDTLASAKDLTMTQASIAIDALGMAVEIQTAAMPDQDPT